MGLVPKQPPCSDTRAVPDLVLETQRALPVLRNSGQYTLDGAITPSGQADVEVLAESAQPQGVPELGQVCEVPAIPPSSCTQNCPFHLRLAGQQSCAQRACYFSLLPRNRMSGNLHVRICGGPGRVTGWAYPERQLLKMMGFR